MAAVAAEAAATAASPGEGGAGEAEPEMEPIPGSEAGTDPLPVTATEASVPEGEADGQQSSPQADEPPLPPPPPPPGELARNPEAAGPELEAEEKLPARVVELAAAAPQEGPDLPPSPAPPPEQPPAPEERQEPPLPQPAAPALVPPAGGDSAVSQLIPGSEVRVTLDHIIEDALVVSFRLGEKLFSGVLMDLSKRSQQMAAITSDSDESCCSLAVSDRPLWIQTGSIEVNSETGRSHKDISSLLVPWTCNHSDREQQSIRTE
ncbi:PREDICTED: PWWP domain-containing protein 2A isoform X2 [Hipposideros armiger]|uniref:PWWP domain-containing protein 2A isoform X2 n=1 Tax=Hipposideros armiger TaxID=186990 RepID=A0A8B7T4Y0_HIPAR|nr:PREDICTED: PWWP domain-containing protein 2A isoform X2 [Hipposideros armiger]